MQNMYSLLVDDRSEHKKAKEVNKNVVATISHNEYKGALLNNKRLKHSMNRIQNKNHRAGTYLTCFNNEIRILNNEYNGLSLGYEN